MPKPGPSLRGRLFVFALALAIPLLELSGATAWHAYKGEQRRAEDRLRDTARAVARSADAEASFARVVLQVIANSPVLADGQLDALRPEMERVSEALHGATVCVTGPEGARLAVGGPEAGCNTGLLRASLSLPGLDGAPHMLSVALPDGTLAQALTRQSLRPGWTVTIAERDGAAALRFPIGAGHSAQPAVAVPTAVLVAAASQDEGVLRDVAMQGGASSAIAFARAPITRMLVLVAAAEAEFDAPLRAMLLRLGFIGVILLAVVLGGGIVLARRVVALSSIGVVPGIEAESRLAAPVRAEELAQAEVQFRTVFELLPDALALVRVEWQTGRLLYEAFNPAAERLTGVPALRVVGRQADDAMPPGVAVAVLDRQRECVARCTPLRCQSILAYPAGTRTLEEHLIPLCDPVTGRVIRLVCWARDITEQRALHVRPGQEHGAQELGQLAGGVAHHVNNVLQAVSGSVLLIRKRLDDPAALQRLTGIILEAVERGTALTRQLLVYARRDELRAEAISPFTLLHEMSEVMIQTLGGAIRLELRVEEALPCLLADRAGLEAALIAITTNARDAMPAGGTMRVQVEAEVVQPGAAHPGQVTPGAYVRLDLIDTGVGMSAEVLARVVDPFFTTKAIGQGTGLGLSMARGFAEQSGGGLTLATSPGQGTTVTLWLPQERVAGNMTEPAATISWRVLLVDDDALVREVLSEQLTDHGFKVAALSDAEAALAWLDEHVPDLLVTDRSMPGMDGLTLIRAAQGRWPGLPAILLTGYAGDGVQAAEDRPYSVLRKPVSGAQLAERASAVLEMGGFSSRT